MKGEVTLESGWELFALSLLFLPNHHENLVFQQKCVLLYDIEVSVEAIRHLAQRLSILLVKGNSALLLNRLPSFPTPEVNGIE